MPVNEHDGSEANKTTPSQQEEQEGRSLTEAPEASTTAEQAHGSLTGLKEEIQQQPNTPLAGDDLTVDADKKIPPAFPKKPNISNMDAVASSSRTAIEGAISSASSKETKSLSRTPGITEVYRLENIQTSIRTRPQLVPSFTDLSARDKLTFSSIEKDVALKIKVVEAKVSIAQVRAIRRGTTLINSRDIEKSKKSEISAIQKSATEKKQALFANVKPVFAETDRSFTETELHAIFDRFAQKLTSIEKERTANIQRTENKAGIAQSLTARAPRPRIAIIVTIDKKRNLAVSEIEKTATHQKNILFLQAKQEL